MRRNESPSGAFKRRAVCVSRWRGLAPTSSAERDKREMKIKFPLTMARAKRRPFWMVWLIKEMLQMDRSFQIRHFGEKAVGGFDFLGVFM